MKSRFRRIAGVVLLVLGLGCWAYCGFRAKFPTAQDHQRHAYMAEHGTDPGNPLKPYFFGGLALMVSGSALMKF
jgi:hypothetical protein